MKKLNTKHPVYSQMKALVADGEGPWKIAAVNRLQARNAQSSLSQIGSLSGVKYTTSLKNLVVTVERICSVPEPVYDLKSTPSAEAAGRNLWKQLAMGPREARKVLDNAITDCERKISDLSTDLRIQEAILKALIEVRDAPLF